MELKMVRALRNGSWDGHRRRIGAVFPVVRDASESWFVDVGPAPEGTELPKQIMNAQAPAAKSFVDVMEQLKDPVVNEAPRPMTLGEAHAAGLELV